MKRVAVLPTLVTLANGYCGILAIYKVHDGRYYAAAGLVLLAMLFDLLDGKVARMAGLTSRFGAYIDSLSDAISFGVAPAFLVKAVVETKWPDAYGAKLLTFLTSVYALCAVLRLARYNVEHASGEGTDRQGRGVTRFAGMPTPGAAGVLVSLVFLSNEDASVLDYSYVLVGLPVLCALLGYLMISRVPYDHLGSRFLTGRGDFRYLFAVIVVVALVSKWPEESAAAGCLAYMLSGPVLAPWRYRRERERDEEEDEVEIPDGV